MTLALHTIKPAEGSTKKRKRIGRGNASGQGTYAGKGLKGQKCRSGVSNLKRLGMKQVLLRTPKTRGFNSLKPKDQVVSLSDVNTMFKDGEAISVKALFEKGLINTTKEGVKVLNNGDITLKDLKFKDVKMSESVKAKIEKLGGKISFSKSKK
jgi:large subunit ribosomal protein L15